MEAGIVVRWEIFKSLNLVAEWIFFVCGATAFPMDLVGVEGYSSI